MSNSILPSPVLPSQTSQIVYTADKWCPGHTLMICDSYIVPNLPITIDCLTFQNCAFDVLDLKCYENLKTLTIAGCNIKEMRGFPESLQILRLRKSNLGCAGKLPTLPNLKKLVCVEMKLNELPPLPASLTYLDCSVNDITSLPELPPYIECLDCSLNNLSGELHLPPTLIYVDCSHNRITSIPTAPPRIRSLHCAFNLINELPPLSASLRTLDFRVNPIKRYPYIYDPSMHIMMSTQGTYFKVLEPVAEKRNENETVILDGVRVFLPYLDPDTMNYIMCADWVSYKPTLLANNESLELVLEVQRQVDTGKFLSAIKEELIAATWHTSRVEAWCGVDFSDPLSD